MSKHTTKTPASTQQRLQKAHNKDFRKYTTTKTSTRTQRLQKAHQGHQKAHNKDIRKYTTRSFFKPYNLRPFITGTLKCIQAQVHFS